jgi:hypothetical protein
MVKDSSINIEVIRKQQTLDAFKEIEERLSVKKLICKCGHSKREHIHDKYGRAYNCKKCKCNLYQLNTNRATEELVSIPPNPKGIGYP